MDPLTVVDEIFLRTHRGMGTPIALQGLWRTPDAMEPALLQAIHHQLRHGPLGRRVVTPRVPGARRTWHPNVTAHPLDLLPDHTGSAETGWPAQPITHDTDTIATPRGNTPTIDAAADQINGTFPTDVAPPGRAQVGGSPVDVTTGRRGGPLPDRAILPWADSLGTDLDPEFASGWRLSAARLEDGGTVVALTCSHALADARGLIHAITAALESLEATGTDPAPDALTAPRGDPSQRIPEAGDEITGRTQHSEWSDARSQWATVFGGTGRALRRKLSRSPTRHSENAAADRESGSAGAPLPTVPNPRPHSDPSTARRAGRGRPGQPGGDHGRWVANSDPVPDRHLRPLLLTFDADHWDATATTLGATSNSLFIHLIANILWHNGFPDPTIIASLPVDTRDEPRVDNDLAMTEIAIERFDTPATIRDKAKTAYQRRMSSPAGLPEEILQVVPDRLAYTLSKGAGERDILCSNIGALPDATRKVGPHNCTRVAARAIHPGLTTFPRTQLAGYLSRLDNTYTLALVGLTADNDSLPDAIQIACAEAGLEPAPW